ncbi:MAG: ATP-binding cassette domain-containing protein [Calditrichaceae bacterium]
MLQIQNLSYSIGERDLLKEISWIINPGLRVALIGPNGAGKTTLLRILNGELETSRGNIIKPRTYKIGYLPQEEISVDTGSILSLVLEGHQEIIDIEDEMNSIHSRLEFGGEDQTSILERLGDLESSYSVLGGYELESLAKKILVGLGFKQTDFHRPVSDFSGGWRMRGYLARILIQQPDLLLLDEPTNHLDLESLEWLEIYLRSFPGSMIIVSHDRFFLDRLAQEIAEVERGILTHYAGNYRFYEKKKALIHEQLLKKWEEQKDERERLQKFIDRFRYKATKAAQVQSRVKRLEKLEEIEIPKETKSIHFKIKADVVSYREVLQISDLDFRYDTEWVLRNLNLNIIRGEKVALVGVNGAGKTTLTRLITEQLKPISGTLNLGERVQTGYYAQHQVDTLNLDNTIYDEVASAAARSFQPKLRDILGVFQFSGGDIEKKIGVLSGGEKARVSLAKILLSPSNFLIMDEPTNHLDLKSKEALEVALTDYDGTLLLISHDRYFLDKLVNRVIELRDGKLTEYLGNYSEYLSRREEISYNAPASETVRPDDSGKPAAKKSKEQKRIEAEARQNVSKERNRLKKEISRLEEKIDILTKRQSELEIQLADPSTYQNADLAATLQVEYNRISDEMPGLEIKWEQAQLEYETLLTSMEQLLNQ